MVQLDQLIADHGSTVIRTTGHQKVTFCKVVCEEEKSRVLDPLVKSWYHYLLVPGFVPYPISIVVLVFTELEEVLEKLQQGFFQLVHHTAETTDNSGVDSDACPRKKKVLSNETYRMKMAWAFDEIARLFVTEPADPLAKRSHFSHQICQRDVLVLTQGSYVFFLRHCQSAEHFAMDQGVRLETPDWTVLD